MADCSDFFLQLNERVTLTNTDRKLLRAARNTIIRKIKKYFEDNYLCQVSFRVQGSFTMNTIIKPVEGEFDIDVGVYLEGYSNWQNDWPKTETASQWLIKALEGHTYAQPVNKRKCVRIIYQPHTANNSIGYHVDLPIYREYTNLLGERYTRIGITGNTQWSEKSDPIGFTKWFNSECQKNKTDKNQLVRIVRYIKAWKQHNSTNTKFPSGMALTVMIAKNYRENIRDDIAFLQTIESAYDDVFSGLLPMFDYYSVSSPVEPFNNLLSRLTENQIAEFKKCFAGLIIAGKAAIQEIDAQKSSEMWHEQFKYFS